MIYLIEFEAFDPARGAVVVERFASEGYTTGAGDDPAHTHFEGRAVDPGNYQRSVFDVGRTSGQAASSFGLIELANPDGRLDRLATYAVDGRPLRIYALASAESAFASRMLIQSGTMEQVEVSWLRASIRMRGRMTALAEPIQPVDYAGTTTHGGLDEAEGAEDDLKGKAKPTLWGRVLNVSPVLANRYDLIWQLSSEPVFSVDAVRDNGVPLTFHADFPTVAALRTASIPAGRYGTALALGLLRTGSTPAGDLTVDAREGADGTRSAALTARRILEHAGFAADVDFVAADFDALHAANPAEVGTWTGLDRRDVVFVVSMLLDSIGAWIVADRLGRFRAARLDAPVFDPAAPVLDVTVILDDGEGLQRLATEDEGRGVPAKKLTLRYAQNQTVQQKATLDQTAATEAVKAFAIEEWRNAVAEDAGVKERHLLAPDLTFDSLLVEASAAEAEAARRLGLYGVRRERYRVPTRAEVAAGIDLGDVVTLRIPRFGLAAGKPFVVIGEEVELASGNITLDIWG